MAKAGWCPAGNRTPGRPQLGTAGRACESESREESDPGAARVPAESAVRLNSGRRKGARRLPCCPAEGASECGPRSPGSVPVSPAGHGTASQEILD